MACRTISKGEDGRKQEGFKTGGNHFARKISVIRRRKPSKTLPFPSQNEGKIKLLLASRAKVVHYPRDNFDNGNHLTAGLNLLSRSNSCYCPNETCLISKHTDKRKKYFTLCLFPIFFCNILHSEALQPIWFTTACHYQPDYASIFI